MAIEKLKEILEDRLKHKVISKSDYDFTISYIEENCSHLSFSDDMASQFVDGVLSIIEYEKFTKLN